MEFTKEEREAVDKLYSLVSQSPIVRADYYPYLAEAIEHGRDVAKFFRGEWDEPSAWRRIFRGKGCE